MTLMTATAAHAGAPYSPSVQLVEDMLTDARNQARAEPTKRLVKRHAALVAHRQNHRLGVAATVELAAIHSVLTRELGVQLPPIGHVDNVERLYLDQPHLGGTGW